MRKYLLRWKLKGGDNDLSYIGKRTPIWKPMLFLLPSLALIIFMTVIPMITTAESSFTVQLNAHKAGATHLGMDHYVDLFANVYFLKAMSNSLLYAILVVPISIMISLTISVTIANIINRKARSSAQTVFFLPYVTSMIAVSMAFMFLFTTTGVVNKIFGLDVHWLTNTDTSSHSAFFVILFQGIWSSLAFQILIFTTAILGIDKDRYKAAAIDGAGPVKTLFRITIPSIRRTMSFIITVGLIGAIKVFPLALFNNDAGQAQTHGGATLMIFIYNAVSPSGGTPDFPAAAAAAVFLVILAIAFNVVVKNAIKFVGFVVVKGGEYRVKTKIENSRKKI